MKKTGLLFILGLVLLCGCKRAAITEYTEPSIASPGRTMAVVEQCIMEAGARYGWLMQKIKPGLIEGTLHVRTHTAVVEIPFSTETYSIRYKSSTNLSAEDGKIHKNYNRWVRNLAKEINARLSAAASR